MAKYIDIDLLRKEIEKERKSIEGLFIEGDNNFYDGQDDAYNHTLALIDSLQQEQQEVDLEEITKFSRIKELPAGFDKDWLKYYHLDKEYNSVKFHHLSALEREYIIARHFYELGKNSK